MMFLNNLMNSRNLTRAELSASSNIPESTLRDILNGKAQLDRCEAVTLYNLAYALDVSVRWSVLLIPVFRFMTITP